MSTLQTTPFEVLQLDLNQFRLDLKALEVTVIGMAEPVTHEHNTERVLSGISYARLVEILAPYQIEFEDGQYGVSLTGGNNNILDVKVPNQVSVLANNSGGLINSEAINNQSFLGGKVFINTRGQGFPGTLYPIGTPSKQSDNFLDSRQIADVRGYDSFVLDGNLTLNPTDDTEGTNWQGKSPIRASLTLNGNNTNGSEILNMALTGQANGFMAVRDCRVSNVSDFWGTMRDCLMQGTVILDPTRNGPIVLAGCTSGIPGASKFMLDCNFANTDVQIRNYTGGIEIENFDQGNNMSIDVISGIVELKPTCTAGTIVVRGVVQLIDNTGPGCNVITDGTVTELTQGGSGVWTVAEKDKIISDVEITKDQSEISAIHAVDKLNE